MDLQTVWTILLISAFTFPEGFTIYFTQTQVEFHPRQLVKPNETIYNVTATLDPDEFGQVIYSLNYSETNCSALDINKSTGNIFIKNHRTFEQDIQNTTCRYTISAIIKEQPGPRGKKDCQMTLYVKKIKGISEMIDCSSLTKKELCFDDSSSLKVQVMENSGEMTVALLGLYMKCFNGVIKYNVTVEEDVLFVKESSENFSRFKLRVRSNLNRESKDSFTFLIQCSIALENIETVESMNGTLVVLDQDDNPPMTQTEGLQHQTVYISFAQPDNIFKPNSQLYAKKSSLFITLDKDTVEVNNFKVSLNDTRNLLVVKHMVIAHSHGTIPVTSVYLRIFLSDKVEGSRKEKWEGLYCVTISVNDTSLVPGHGNSEMTFRVCLHWDDYDYDSVKIEPGLTSQEVDTIFKNGIFEGTFSRKISTKAPVLYSFKELIRDVSELEHLPIFEFGIESFHIFDQQQKLISGSTFENDVENPFDISTKMGIIFLNDPQSIKNSNIHLVILNIISNVSFGNSFTQNHSNIVFRTNISIYVEGELDTKESIDCEHSSCAEFSEPDKCTFSCGFGTQEKCYWDYPMNNSIGDVKSQDDYPGRNYETCTPLPQTCPDTKCDEVEKMFPLLCPQDCAEELTGFGVLINRKNGMKYGIDSGKGVCSCHGLLSCSCGYLPNVLSTSFSISNSENPVEAIKDIQSSCDQNCIMFLSAAGLLCLVTLAGVSYFWRFGSLYRKKHLPVKRALITSGSHSEDNSTNNMTSGGEYLGPEQSELVPIGFGSQFDSYTIIDAKWEIARSELALEQILGEGEFGRVLKGRVHDSEGYERHSAVAVKMLKEHGSENGKSSRQEFMAEFSLLKQVDHPNVVKLLGACTTAGGPPYLILEYAEYGSLRSFLKRCRRVENLHSSTNGSENSEDLMREEPLDFDPKKYIVTPSEILGFSWQIAKGMVYLSDMKMVHRDLAARNILLTEDKVCKISDFGLTRDIYVDDAYRKKSKDRVPVKWLAPECLEDEFYTSKSDVWAYGILLWELATLGASPYPGIQSEHLYSLLKSGYRMEQPINCSIEMYSLMQQCWINEPHQRPYFRQIESSLSKLLEEGIEYLRLDISTVWNPGYQYFDQSEEDSRPKVQDMFV